METLAFRLPAQSLLIVSMLGTLEFKSEHQTTAGTFFLTAICVLSCSTWPICPEDCMEIVDAQVGLLFFMTAVLRSTKNLRSLTFQ